MADSPPMPPRAHPPRERARPRWSRRARRWIAVALGLVAPLFPANGASPDRYVELRAGTAVDTTIGSGSGAAPMVDLAVGKQLGELVAAELSVGVVAVPLALTGRLILPTEKVHPYLVAGAGVTAAHAVATPERDGPIQREDFVSLELHAGFGFVAELGDRLTAGAEVRYSHSSVEAFGLDFSLPGIRYSAGLGWRF